MGISRHAACWLVAATLTQAAASRGDVTLLEDFESYASTAELEAAWVDMGNGSLPTQLLDTGGQIVGKSLRFDYDVSDGYDDALQFTLPTATGNVFTRTFVIWYRTASGNSTGDIEFDLIRATGGTFRKTLVGGTSLAPGAPQHWEFSDGWTPYSVTGIRLRVKAHAGGAGTVYFDSISMMGGTYGSCRSCHGKFDEGTHVALTDGETWSGTLMSVHSDSMLGAYCEYCHKTTTGSPTRWYPVLLDASDAGDPGSCVMCHGREEDMGHDGASDGRGAGLRQHHKHTIGNGGPAGCCGGCQACHADSNAWVLEPVAETVDPPLYAVATSPPLDPCNGSERFESPVHGLDNDGDGLYDWEDWDCQAVAETDPDLDNLRASIDPCPGHPNLPPIDDDNGDGIPNACQCADGNGDGFLSSADVTVLNACFGGGSCDTTIVDANNDGAVTVADLSLLSQVLSGEIPASSLTCARRPTGLAAANAFGLLHVGAGSATLDASGGSLVVGSIGSDGSDGVGWHLGDELAGDLTLGFSDVDPLGTLPAGASLRAKLVGRVEGASPEQIALLSMRKGATGFEYELNATPLGAFTYRYEVRLAGETVARSPATVGEVEAPAAATAILVRSLLTPPGVAAHWLFPAATSLSLDGWGSFVGDELVIATVQASKSPDGFSSVELRAAGLSDLTLTHISTAAPVPILPGHTVTLAALLGAAGIVALRVWPRRRGRS